MPYPTKYIRQYDYVSYQNSNPTRPLPATKVNADLNQLQLSTAEIVDFLKKSIRADGKIMNGAVGLDQIDPSVNLGFTPPTEWAPLTVYTVNTSTVFYGDAFYSALASHTSGPEFDPTKWLLIADFAALADAAALAAINSNANLHAIAGLTSAADKGIVFTGVGTAMTFDLSAFSRTLLAGTSAGAMLTTLGVSAFAQTVLDDADGATVMNTIGALPKAGGTMTGALTLAADPASALQAATKQYVDAVAQGLDTKPSVIAATTANITLSAPQTIDGIAVIAGDRVLVKNQSTASQNGIYVVAAGAWTRATDADAWAELPGAFVFVEKGTINTDCGFVCTVDAGGTIGSTSVTFTQFSGAGTYSTTGGVTLTGTQFSITAHGITNAMRSQMAAFTLKGNITGSFADEADFTIGSLTHKTVPAGSDIVMFQDQAASGALKYATWTEVIGGVASGVSSIGGNTGAFTTSNGVTLVGNDIRFSPAAAATVNVIKTQKFTASGTYTPSAGIQYAIIECIGGGGGGGGVTGVASGSVGAGGGGSGSYSRIVVSAATIGASQTVTVGSGGTGGGAGNNSGLPGSDTSVGALCIGKGGSGGGFAQSGVSQGAGGAGGVAGTGALIPSGNSGATGPYATITTISLAGGNGGAGMFGGYGTGGTSGGTGGAGFAAPANSGGGGGGASAIATTNSYAGSNGGSGIVLITEFANQ
jgi:hypothetical protein